MHATDLIRRKRDGEAHSREEIAFLIEGCASGAIPDYQLSAWLMAVYHRGMTAEETVHLTEAMLNSGAVMDWSGSPGIKVDKHSTGGVGDKTSLVVAPVVAAAGVQVPMISGRGLGHTGGTLDKLESIPGFRVGLSLDEFRRAVDKVGCALAGQTGEIAPADRRLYALRDVTATVESIPLITSSILSKKLAEGIDGLVLDVKFGSGAFMKDVDSARELATSLQTIGARMGKRVVALLTGMDQPLGHAVGNALEVIECVEVLRGGGPEDLRDLCRELSAWMLLLGDAAKDIDEGRARYDELIANGKAAAKFQEIIANQGGDPAIVDDPARLPAAQHSVGHPSRSSGFVARIQAEWVGRAGMLLGAGRMRSEDSVDPAVGLTVHKKLGDEVAAGEPLVTLHYNGGGSGGENLAAARELLNAAFTVAESAPQPQPLVLETLT